ncbi:hypothetical protein BAUCODRAFT_307758 [Baudoinia panamericana UAMH 10762]|uniref:FAM50A/XAP5 C-terminal domain-containing protein n=1 Tax=Baudoinia panamericana (strain UAMH 10762) TaxID=717646 RepID=M2MYU6_BAUPA|nr:uncharacterized protein BAUCODRAFT_307758 [Baudoinia panamericana UAMH 10762]EMC91849.1 hypothetical protein BAUCODRAFT_307758 [Baudoinia panamericana UAMH 10762]
MADTSTPSKPSSGSATPDTRFTSQVHTTEDLLKEQTYGLVHLSDFRKRRAEALEASLEGSPAPSSGAATPDGREPATKAGIKKRKKGVKRGGLSFGNDEEHDDTGMDGNNGERKSATPAQTDSDDTTTTTTTTTTATVKKGLKPNSSLAHQPKALTKSTVLRENALKDQLRRQYTALQEAVKQTDFILPFTFFNGKSAPGGICRMKKGDQIWLFLERARKVGAETRKDWARIGVDDLMVVRNDLIVPHHYDFHYFILNRSVGYKQKPIFAYSAEPTAATPAHLLPTTSTPNIEPTNTDPTSSNLLSTASSRKAAAAAAPRVIPDSELEGFTDDPATTKVVDRRWYERNKHIYPASMWEEFDPGRDYSKAGRKDAEGNAMFFGRS